MSVFDFISTLFRRAFFSRRVRADVWQLLADLTSADMDVAEAFNTTATVYRQRRQGQVADILLDMRGAIPRNSLPKMIDRYAPGGESLLFASYGQADAYRLFRGAARIARADLIISRAIASAIAMPSVLAVMICAILYLGGTQLFPSFADLVPVEEWPGHARSFGIFSIWAATNGYLIAIGAGVFFVAIRTSIPLWIGPGRKFADTIPPYNFYKMRMGASFLFAIVEGGRMGQAINSEYLFNMAERGNRYTRDRISNIARYVARTSLGAATVAADQDFPAKDLNTILNAISGQENWFEKLSGFTDRWLEDVEARAKRTAVLLNVVLLTLAASLIGLLMSSIFLISQSLAY